jgi:hypothetical protein
MEARRGAAIIMDVERNVMIALIAVIIIFLLAFGVEKLLQ